MALSVSSNENKDAANIPTARSYIHDKEESLWTIFHKLKAVLDTSSVDKRNFHVIYDDSKRVVNMSEIIPNLFIGDEGAAKNTFYLKKIKISHVLNAAQGSGPGYVDTDGNYYKLFGIKYKGLKLSDAVQTNIAMYFQSVANFIEDALSDGGRVLVNCMMGMSRSSTCVLAYLMIKRHQTAVDALVNVRKYRDVRPNDGFLRQLADLDNKLRKEELTRRKDKPK